MQSMKGLVSLPSGDLSLEDVAIPRLGENPYARRDVLLQVEHCGICGSDILLTNDSVLLRCSHERN
jgi:threonine dehydrogenase-like Zn-dependent dehydrogenase